MRNYMESSVSWLDWKYLRMRLLIFSKSKQSVSYLVSKKCENYNTRDAKTWIRAKVCLADKVRLLGVTLDTSLSLNTHVKNVCRTAFYHTRALRHIRPSLTEEMVNLVACSLVQSRRDYANALYVGMSSANFDALQWAQNTIALEVCRHGDVVAATDVMLKL